MSIEFEGVEELLKSLDRMLSPEKIEKALMKSCALVERAAKQKAPKDSGELRRSITSEVKNKVGYVFTPLEYAPYVEYGTGLFAEKGGRQYVPWHYKDDEGEWHTTSGQHPHPFMRPALEENREQILEFFKEAANNE